MDDKIQVLWEDVKERCFMASDHSEFKGHRDSES